MLKGVNPATYHRSHLGHLAPRIDSRHCNTTSSRRHDNPTGREWEYNAHLISVQQLWLPFSASPATVKRCNKELLQLKEKKWYPRLRKRSLSTQGSHTLKKSYLFCGYPGEIAGFANRKIRQLSSRPWWQRCWTATRHQAKLARAASFYYALKKSATGSFLLFLCFIPSRGNDVTTNRSHMEALAGSQG